MTQGKLKTKTKVPANVKVKQKKKGQAFTRRSNAPIQPKKAKFQEAQKIKQAITKVVNRSAEDEIRCLATSSSQPRNLSQAQEAVAKHNKSLSETASTCTS